MWPWLRHTVDLTGRVWDKLLKAAPVRVWAIILGAPPLCGMVLYILHLLAGLAVQDEPVRVPIVMAIANMGYLLIATVLVIVVALAAVSLMIRGPGGWEFGVNDDEPDTTRITTHSETTITPSPIPAAQPSASEPHNEASPPERPLP